MRVVRWVGLAVFAAAATAVGCGISPTGEMSAPGDDASSSGSSGGSSGASTSSSSGSGSGSGSGSSSGVTKDASPHEAGSSGGPDATTETGGPDGGDGDAGDATTGDAPAEGGPCTTSADCKAGEACQPDGTCATNCSSTILCNKSCCDDPTNGQCWTTGNGSCNQGGQCTSCTCMKPSDCPKYWACGPGGTCTQNCDPMHMCNGGCCSDVVGGTCVGTDCTSPPQSAGPQCTSQGFCGCTNASQCSSSSYGPDCNPVMGVMGLNECGCKCTNGANDDCPVNLCTGPTGNLCPQTSGDMRCR